MYEFYRGMEIHPRLMGVDVKQWTNCRVGLMGWQVLILAFFIAGLRQGFNPGHFANVFLQTIYIGKFFWWETGYFNTLDITLDRAGYYICWGCLVWVPGWLLLVFIYYMVIILLLLLGFYTYSSFYLVEHQSTITSVTAIFDVFLGNF
jgi:7-dehydrocholesterol reductase